MENECISKVWMLDPNDKSCPKNLKEEMFEKFQRNQLLSNGSVASVSIQDLTEYSEDGECPYPVLLEFLRSQGFDEEEDVYLHIYW